MDFGFSDEQEMLRDAARRLLDDACPPSFVRTMMEDPTAHAPELWRRIAELGWLGILIPEANGGLGGDLVDMTVVLEEAGKALLPGPFFATALLGVPAVALGGSPEQREAILPAVARGERRLTLALTEAEARWDAAGVALPAVARGAEYVLSGEKAYVMDAHVADTIVVAARTGGEGEAGLTLFLVDGDAPGVSIEQLQTVDMTRRQCTVRLRDVRVPRARVLGEVGGGWPIVRRVLDHAEAGIAVELVGTTQRALDRAVAYAGQRTQFGRPIGSFQAVKHKCVDMMVGVETARSLTYYAAWAVSERAPDARQAAAMAKAYCSDVGRLVTSEAIQVHGGIGFTWEHDMHLYHRRALASEAAFGSALEHRETVARALLS
jgi:alkylation response protein AidB-like acyl-CoA dehydrogenase